MTNSDSVKFWQTKTLAEMTAKEWESLCDGCGKCCLHKLLEEREDLPADAPMELGEDLHYTHVACKLLNSETGGCRYYPIRHRFVPGCVELKADDLEAIHYMPPSCSYRRLQEGRGLPSWHPLLHDGSRAAMDAAGMSVASYVAKGYLVTSDEQDEPSEATIVTWPLHDCD